MSLKFRKWIEDYGGATVLAAKLGLHEPTVRVWMRGQGAPSAHIINDLIKLSKGALSFDEIYKESMRERKSKVE